MSDDDDKKRTPRDSLPTVMSLTVSGLTAHHILESARTEAAKLFQVPASRVKVQVGSISVATHDPFPTDLDTYAQVDQLVGHAKCILLPDPDAPAHDTL